MTILAQALRLLAVARDVAQANDAVVLRLRVPMGQRWAQFLLCVWESMTQRPSWEDFWVSPGTIRLLGIRVDPDDFPEDRLAVELRLSAPIEEGA